MVYTPLDVLCTISPYPQVEPVSEVLLEVRKESRVEESLYMGIPDEAFLGFGLLHIYVWCSYFPPHVIYGFETLQW